MSTKVKGDKIKEGSIPLSALASEVKDKIENAGGGADWNAQKGEAGYIENKPFKFLNYDGTEYKFAPENFLKGEDFTPYEVDDWGDVFSYRKPTNITQLKYVVSNLYSTEEGELYYGPFRPVRKVEGNKFDVDAGVYYGGKVYMETDDEGNNYIVVKTYMTNGNFFPENSVYIISDEYVQFSKLEETLLADTVVKTTPQSLSYNNKNQALANLGIDPVVWKYICNPYILEHNNTIPSELLNEDDNNHFKYLNRGMYLIRLSSGKINEQDWDIEGEVDMIIPVNLIEDDGCALAGMCTLTDKQGNMITTTAIVSPNNGKININSYQN